MSTDIAERAINDRGQQSTERQLDWYEDRIKDELCVEFCHAGDTDALDASLVRLDAAVETIHRWPVRLAMTIVVVMLLAVLLGGIVWKQMASLHSPWFYMAVGGTAAVPLVAACFELKMRHRARRCRNAALAAIENRARHSYCSSLQRLFDDARNSLLGHVDNLRQRTKNLASHWESIAERRSRPPAEIPHDMTLWLPREDGLENLYRHLRDQTDATRIVGSAIRRFSSDIIIGKDASQATKDLEAGLIQAIQDRIQTGFPLWRFLCCGLDCFELDHERVTEVTEFLGQHSFLLPGKLVRRASSDTTAKRVYTSALFEPGAFVPESGSICEASLVYQPRRVTSIATLELQRPSCS